MGLAQRLLAVSVSFALTLSTPAFAFVARGNTAQASDSIQNEIRLISVNATPTPAGVLLEWHTNAAATNVGFNIYRVKDGQRTRANQEIVPGVQFASGTPALMRGGYSFAWLDQNGTADSVYFIESVDSLGGVKMGAPVVPVPGVMSREFQRPPGPSGPNAAETTNSFERQAPSLELHLPSTPNGTLQDQWAIVAQPALRIGIKKDGWYRITQPQMVSAGFNPTVDIRNLQLFVNANEVAISASQSSGQFSSADYIEFYGQGIDLATSDTRIYYLLAGSTPGKRVGGEFHVDGPPPPPPPTSTPPPAPGPSTPPMTPAPEAPVWRNPIFFSWIDHDLRVLSGSLQPATTPTAAAAPPIVDRQNENFVPDPASANRDEPDVNATAAKPVAPLSQANAEIKLDKTNEAANASTPATNANAPTSASLPAVASPKPAVTKSSRKGRRSSKRRKQRTLRRQNTPERHHVMLLDGFAPVNFSNTVAIKDRFVYLTNLLNGDEENWFGRVISAPATITVNVSNLDTTATTQATLEFALQGVISASAAYHQVVVSVNNNPPIGSPVDFGPAEHPVRSFTVPLSQLVNGANQIKFTKTSSGEVCIVDYLNLIYPHTYKADANALKFSLLGTQTLKVDGFSTPLVRLIDITDPLNVSISKPVAESTASGYAITVPPSEAAGKNSRLLYAIPQTQFDTPATISVNQPSSLNQNSSAANFLIVSYKDFIPSMEPLRAARASGGMISKIVDVEDIYDEFSYGVHTPYAIKDFLEYASTHWNTNNGIAAPRYIVFAGDASLDPRDYQHIGNQDLVPTKLVDATYNETCSDDWLADFDNNGIADIPVGRLPVKTPAEAVAVVNKIINFTPLAVQNAMLVADDPAGYYFNFEQANDQVADILAPAGVQVQKAYRALELKSLTGTVTTSDSSSTVTGTGTAFLTDLQPGDKLLKAGERIGAVFQVTSNTSLTLNGNALVNFSGPYGKQDDAIAKANIIASFNQGLALANYTGHGNVDVWTGGGIFRSPDALALTNSNALTFVVVMDCLNGYFQDPLLFSLSEALLKSNGGAVAAFASSGLTLPDGQHQMALQLYSLIYGSQPISLGDAIKASKSATTDIDVKRTWVYFGDPSIKIR